MLAECGRNFDSVVFSSSTSLIEEGSGKMIHEIKRNVTKLFVLVRVIS